MTITNNDSLIINIDEKTQLFSKEEIVTALKTELLLRKALVNNDYVKVNSVHERLKFKGVKEEPSCANYERDNICQDPIVESVRHKLLSRSDVGRGKYLTTLKENTKDNYLVHLQDEIMDAANYIECLLQQKKDITQLVALESNDMALGKLIRQKYGK
jgi:hypothetical protein